MKRTTKLLSMLLLLLFMLSGCTAKVAAPEVSETSTSVPDTAEVIQTDNNFQVIIDVYDDYYGQYCLMSNVKFEHYDDDGLPDYIWVENPALLAFQVGREFEGGLGTIEGTSVEYMISNIEEYMENNELDYDDAEMFKNILNILNNVVVVTGAST